MRRTIDQTLADLRRQVRDWAEGTSRPEIKVLVYPPEWEAVMLARFPSFVERCAAEGHAVELEDAGRGFLDELESRHGILERLSELDRGELLHDLGWLAATYLKRAMLRPVPDGLVCRLVVNTGSLGTFVSYSAILNELSGGKVPAVVVAFPGEADERSLNLLHLRGDSNYRVARI